MSYTAAVLTVSDRGFRGERRDESGPAVRAILEELCAGCGETVRRLAEEV